MSEQPADETAQDRTPADQDPEGEPTPAERESPTPRPRVRPEQTRDDTDRGWGERPDEDEHDRWLREQRPPHWE